MSRHVLTPNSNSFDLIPIDQTLKKKAISIPDGLFVDMGIFNQVQDQQNLKRLLCKLARTGISRTSKGQIRCGNNHLDGGYDEGLVSCCDGNFREAYNEFYSLLKYNGISF
tara:strand:- start:115 stop:447 length:333 start_codon:yes stop_codon:yes gene_type:complete